MDDKKKTKYGTFKNVLLSDDEYHALRDKFRAITEDKIEDLSLGIESKGYKYKSHYAAILAWERRNAKGIGGGNHGTNRNNLGRQPAPSEYESPEEYDKRMLSRR